MFIQAIRRSCCRGQTVSHDTVASELLWADPSPSPPQASASLVTRSAHPAQSAGDLPRNSWGAELAHTRDPAPTVLDASDPKAKQTHIPEGESFAEYLVRRASSQSVSSAAAPTGRTAVTYSTTSGGYDPKKRAALESSYSATPATSSAAFVAAPVPVGAARARIDYGRPGYSPQSRPSAPATAEFTSSVEPPSSRPKLAYGTPAYNPRERGALERAFSAPDAPNAPRVVSDAAAAVTVTARTVDYSKPYGGYDPKARPSPDSQGKLAQVFAAAAEFVKTVSPVEAAPQLSAKIGTKMEYKVSPTPETPNPQPPNPKPHTPHPTPQTPNSKT